MTLSPPLALHRSALSSCQTAIQTLRSEIDPSSARLGSARRMAKLGASSCLSVAFGLATLCAARSASAQALGAEGRIVVSVEDVTGYYAEKYTYDNRDNDEISDSRSQLSLLLRDGARVGFSYFVLPRVSLGGTVGFESVDRSRSQPDGPGTNVVEGDADYSFLLHAKAGYLLPISGRAGFWFRGGPGVRRTSMHPLGAVDTNSPYKIKETHWLLGLDALFVVAPSPTFGIFAGPCADFSIVGRHSEADSAPNVADFSHSASYRRLGGGLGIMGIF